MKITIQLIINGEWRGDENYKEIIWRREAGKGNGWMHDGIERKVE